MRLAIWVFMGVLVNTFMEPCSTEHLEIQERAVWDTLNAIGRLTNDFSRNDYVDAGMDSIIIVESLPVPWVIRTLLNLTYTVLKFIRPVYWWVFPSTKPKGIQGHGFTKVKFHLRGR